MVKCTRCGRTLKKKPVIKIDGYPYGPVCAEKVRKEKLKAKQTTLERWFR